MLHCFHRAPGALVDLVADAKIEEGGAFAMQPLDHQPEQQFAGARLGNQRLVDGGELADDVISLSGKGCDRRDVPVMLALQA